jgi:hypothetical protein
MMADEGFTHHHLSYWFFEPCKRKGANSLALKLRSITTYPFPVDSKCNVGSIPGCMGPDGIDASDIVAEDWVCVSDEEINKALTFKSKVIAA